MPYCLGELRRLRRERDYTLKYVSAQTGMALSNLSRIERGIGAASMKTLGRLAQFYGVTVDSILSLPFEDKPFITVIVALEINSEEEWQEFDPPWKRVEVLGVTLTAREAKIARTDAFGYMHGAVVAHGWANAYWVPGRRTKRGRARQVWSAKDTRALFDGLQ